MKNGLDSFTPQGIAFALIVLTVCFVSGAVIILSAIGYPVPQDIVTPAVGLIFAAGASVITRLLSAREGEAQRVAVAESARAFNAELKAENLQLRMDVRALATLPEIQETRATVVAEVMEHVSRGAFQKSI